MPSKANNITLESFDQLINGIYDAVLDSQAWPRFLRNCAETFNAHGMLLRIQDIKANNVAGYYTHGIDPAFQQQYAEHYIHVDPLIPALLELETGTPAQTAGNFDENIYRKSEYFNDYNAPQGAEQVAGAIISRKNTHIAMCGIQRRDKIGPYTRDEMRTFELLLPHLQRAIDINQQLVHFKHLSEAGSDILDRLHTAVILVDGAGRPCFINKKAESLASEKDWLDISSKSIKLKRNEDSQLLQKLIFNASHANPKTGGTLVASNPLTLQELSILITPINKTSHLYLNLDLSGITAALFLTAKETMPLEISIDIVSKLYNLTHAEARLSTALANGFSLDQIADTYNVSKATLRSQLKTCFQKCGVNRQAELVKLILCGPAALIKSP